MDKRFTRIGCVVLHLLLFFEGSGALRDVHIAVPRAVLAGPAARAILRCSYSLEGAPLYSIRWYRMWRGAGAAARGGAGGAQDSGEFYRYVPREHPPHLVFPLPGTSVDVSQSDGWQVALAGLHPRVSGEFACEVSADAPLFQTEIRAANLTVIAPPFRAPVLRASGGVVRAGAVLAANCSVDASYPQANLTWTLDGTPIATTIAPEPAPDDFSEREAHSHLELYFVEPGLQGGGGGGERPWDGEPGPRWDAAHSDTPQPPDMSTGPPVISQQLSGGGHRVWVRLGGGGGVAAAAGGLSAGGAGHVTLGCSAGLLGAWSRSSHLQLRAAPSPALARVTSSAGSAFTAACRSIALVVLAAAL